MAPSKRTLTSNPIREIKTTNLLSNVGGYKSKISKAKPQTSLSSKIPLLSKQGGPIKRQRSTMLPKPTSLRNNSTRNSTCNKKVKPPAEPEDDFFVDPSSLASILNNEGITKKLIKQQPNKVVESLLDAEGRPSLCRRVATTRSSSIYCDPARPSLSKQPPRRILRGEPKLSLGMASRPHGKSQSLYSTVKSRYSAYRPEPVPMEKKVVPPSTVRRIKRTVEPETVSSPCLRIPKQLPPKSPAVRIKRNIISKNPSQISRIAPKVTKPKDTLATALTFDVDEEESLKPLSNLPRRNQQSMKFVSPNPVNKLEKERQASNKKVDLLNNNTQKCSSDKEFETEEIISPKILNDFSADPPDKTDKLDCNTVKEPSMNHDKKSQEITKTNADSQIDKPEKTQSTAIKSFQKQAVDIDVVLEMFHKKLKSVRRRTVYNELESIISNVKSSLVSTEIKEKESKEGCVRFDITKSPTKRPSPPTVEKDNTITPPKVWKDVLKEESKKKSPVICQKMAGPMQNNILKETSPKVNLAELQRNLKELENVQKESNELERKIRELEITKERFSKQESRVKEPTHHLKPAKPLSYLNSSREINNECEKLLKKLREANSVHSNKENISSYNKVTSNSFVQRSEIKIPTISKQNAEKNPVIKRVDEYKQTENKSFCEKFGTEKAKKTNSINTLKKQLSVTEKPIEVTKPTISNEKNGATVKLSSHQNHINVLTTKCYNKNNSWWQDAIKNIQKDSDTFNRESSTSLSYSKHTSSLTLKTDHVKPRTSPPKKEIAFADKDFFPEEDDDTKVSIPYFQFHANVGTRDSSTSKTDHVKLTASPQKYVATNDTVLEVDDKTEVPITNFRPNTKTECHPSAVTKQRTHENTKALYNTTPSTHCPSPLPAKAIVQKPAMKSPLLPVSNIDDTILLEEDEDATKVVVLTSYTKDLENKILDGNTSSRIITGNNVIAPKATLPPAPETPQMMRRLRTMLNAGSKRAFEKPKPRFALPSPCKITKHSQKKTKVFSPSIRRTMSSIKFTEALLDEEVSLLTCRRYSAKTNREYQNPVSKFLKDGDDKHFIPLSPITKTHTSSSHQHGSAFSVFLSSK